MNYVWEAQYNHEIMTFKQTDIAFECCMPQHYIISVLSYIKLKYN